MSVPYFSLKGEKDYDSCKKTPGTVHNFPKANSVLLVMVIDSTLDKNSCWLKISFDRRQTTVNFTMSIKHKNRNSSSKYNS